MQKKECLAALRAACPDASTAPAETKDLMDKLDKEIEKLEKEGSKLVTKNIHAATKALGKSQKLLTETLEAQSNHKKQWAQHIKEAITTWQGQLKDYHSQQLAFQEVATKAKSDILTARTAIQSLSSGATQATLATIPPITPVTAEQEESPTDPDPEEVKLQEQLQQVLQSCVTVMKKELPGQSGQVEQCLDLTMDQEDEDRERKRPRSMEPFAHSSMPGAITPTHTAK